MRILIIWPLLNTDNVGCNAFVVVSGLLLVSSLALAQDDDSDDDDDNNDDDNSDDDDDDDDDGGGWGMCNMLVVNVWHSDLAKVLQVHFNRFYCLISIPFGSNFPPELHTNIFAFLGLFFNVCYIQNSPRTIHLTFTHFR